MLVLIRIVTDANKLSMSVVAFYKERKVTDADMAKISMSVS